MSTYRLQTIGCPSGHKFSAEVFDSLHVSRRPDIRARILDGSFHRFTCLVCDRTFAIERRLAYSDFSRHHWFVVHPRIDLRHRDALVDFAHRSFRATMIERAPRLVRSWAPGMIHRVVFGLAALREKLIVFDAGLDDRAIEYLKMQLFCNTDLVMHPDTYLHVSEVEAEAIVMHYGPPGELPRRLAIPRALYTMLEVECAGTHAPQPGLFDDILVDVRAVIAPRTPLVPADETHAPDPIGSGA